MPELVHLETEHFELSIWSRNVSKRLDTFNDMLSKRQREKESTTLCFSPGICLVSEPTIYKSEVSVEKGEYDKISLETPLFFENLQYQIEWTFCKEVTDAWVTHRLNLVEESFRFVSRKSNAPRLTGTIGTRNDLGWFRLSMHYVIDGVEHRSAVSFEVLPTKMDLHSDLPIMYDKIDTTYPLLRFRLARTTEQDVSRVNKRQDFPLLWLVNFASLRRQFEDGLKVICNAPHARLQSTVRHQKADRIKGKCHPRLIERVRADVAKGRTSKRYVVERKRLSVDTLENRFIKMVVDSCLKTLNRLHTKLMLVNQSPERQRLSDHFLQEIQSWTTPLRAIQNQPFFKEVGVLRQFGKSTLVLQQRTGYRTVYRAWQELKYYLDVFANQSTISMKSVAEIYEVWCFLEVRSILIEQLQFVEVSSSNTSLQKKDFFEYRLKDGMAGAFKFERADGLKARLAHEPVFRSNGNPIRSYLVTQRPDILLEISFPDGRKCLWLFDAKYRLKTVNTSSNTDCVPDDAINQLHRYRDALIHLSYGDVENQKSRPVFGAFALYPGYFDQVEHAFPYEQSIKEIGIGAFPLLPSLRDGEGSLWLRQFLIKQIGVLNQIHKPTRLHESMVLQDFVRISPISMTQSLYSDLTLTVSVSGDCDNAQGYLNKFQKGTAKWFHLPQNTFSKKYKTHVVSEIQFLALANTSPQNPSVKEVCLLWPVRNVFLKPRNELTEEQTGLISQDTQPFYLFELGKPLTLQTPIRNVPNRLRNTMRLTTLERLEGIEFFKDIVEVYSDALSSRSDFTPQTANEPASASPSAATIAIRIL